MAEAEAKARGGGRKERLLALFALKTEAPTKLQRLLGFMALVAIVLPWVSFLVHQPAAIPGDPEPAPYPGAGSLFGIAGGLAIIGGTTQAPVAWWVVAVIVIVLFLGAVLAMVHRLGPLGSLAGALLYVTVVNAPLVAAGAAHDPKLDMGLALGFWLTVALAALSLALTLLDALGAGRGRQMAHGATAAGARVVEPTAALGAGPSSSGADLLAVRDLTVRFFTYDGVLKALDGVTFNVREREILGIVGETGCGKSVTAKAILRLIPDPPGRITGGEIMFAGINLLDNIEEEASIQINAKGRAKIRRNRRIGRQMEALMRTIRGNDISMIFQEPTAALNPVITIEEQIGETFLTHQIGEICAKVEATRELSALQRRFYAQLKRREETARELEENFRTLSVKRAILKAARETGDGPAQALTLAEVGDLERSAFARTLKLRWLERQIALWRRLPIVGKDHLMGPIMEEVHRRVVEMLKQVNIADPEKKAQSYPFELSGGMQQRAMIAMALACRPRLLLADEPTTALDVTIQAQILSLIRGLRDQFGSSIILITHDLGVVAETCERVGVMYAGVMAEIGTASDIFNRPKHPYTVGLMRSIPETYARTGKLSIIPGSVPSLLTPPTGCRFHPRCPFASESCKKVIPVLSEVAPGHLVSCHLYDHPEFFPAETVKARDAGLDAVWETVVVR